ncbi:hypothetical protein J2R62_17980, partial [Plesiomonas shigelloides]
MLLWQLPHASLFSTLIGFGLSLLTAVVGLRNPRLPSAVFGLLLIMLLNAVFNLPKYGVTVLSAVDTQRPDFAFWLLPWPSVMHLFPLALLVALVCIMQTAAVARTTPDKPSTVSQDFARIVPGCHLSGIPRTFTTNS